MSVHLTRRSFHWLEVHFILHLPKGEFFCMKHTSVVRFGNVHKDKYEVFTFLLVV